MGEPERSGEGGGEGTPDVNVSGEEERTPLIDRIRARRAEREAARGSVGDSGTPEPAVGSDREAERGGSPGEAPGVGSRPAGDRGHEGSDGTPGGVHREAGLGSERPRPSDAGPGEGDEPASPEEVKPKRGRGRPRKEVSEPSKEKPKLEIVPKITKEDRGGWAENLKTLTEKEAKDLLKPFSSALAEIGKYVDEVISITNADAAQAKIWSTITRDEWEVVAAMLIEDGKKSGIIAVAVRATASAYTRLQVGLIVLPRLYETYAFYADHGGFKLFPGLSQKGGSE